MVNSGVGITVFGVCFWYLVRFPSITTTVLTARILMIKKLAGTKNIIIDEFSILDPDLSPPLKKVVKPTLVCPVSTALIKIIFSCVISVIEGVRSKRAFFVFRPSCQDQRAY